MAAAVENGGGSGIFIRVTKRMSPGDTELQPRRRYFALCYIYRGGVRRVLSFSLPPSFIDSSLKFD